MESLRNFINGQFSTRANEFLVQYCPKTLAEKFTIANSDFLDVVASVQAANGAQKKWQEHSPEARSLILQKFGFLIRDNLKLFEIYQIEDLGVSNLTAPKICEIALSRLQRCLEYEKSNSYQSNSSGKQYQLTSGIGVIGILTDWQCPLPIIFENLAASLSCGNVVILHPSEFSARTCLKLAELAIEAGVIQGAFNVLLGKGDELTKQMFEHPGIKYLRYYGQNLLGEKLHLLAAENHKRIYTELGANNAAIVFSNVDLEKSVGQVLKVGLGIHEFGRARINRILVQEKIWKDFKHELLTQIDNLDKSIGIQNIVGVLPSADLKSQFSVYLDQSKKDRAKLFYSQSENIKSSTPQTPLTIYEDITNCSTLHTQDLYGPILFLQSFKYAADLSKALNSGALLSTAYIWSNDLVRNQKLAQQLEVANICFNDIANHESVLASDFIKQTGMGTRGVEGLFDFNLKRKVISIK